MTQNIISIALLASNAYGWGINGHMFAAKMAQDQLEDLAPDAFDAATESLQVLCDYDGQYWCTTQNNHPFVECSTFADEFKYGGASWQGEIHYTNIPYYQDGSAEDYDAAYYQWNITESVPALIQWLSYADDGDDYESAYVYTYLTGKYVMEVAKSYALRLLIHYVADMHQPFHTMEMYSSEYPDGDEGGNKIDLPSHYGDDELHAVWDHMMYTQHTSIKRPIPDDYWSTFCDDTDEMLARNIDIVSDSSTYENLNTFQWALDAYTIGTTKYDGVTEDEALPDWYISENTQVCEEQIVLAGYRLYWVIQYIFSESDSKQTSEPSLIE